MVAPNAKARRVMATLLREAAAELSADRLGKTNIFVLYLVPGITSR